MPRTEYETSFLPLAFSAVIVFLLAFSPGTLHGHVFASAQALPYPLNQVHSGLVAYDPLNNVTATKDQLLAAPKYWTYYGTAVNEKFTTYNVWENSKGLHIGEAGPDDQQFWPGSYSGYYAVSPDTSGRLVHATLTATSNPVTSYDFQTQLQVMQSSGDVNYITCGAVTNADGTYWEVVHGYGDAFEATNWDTLWTDTSANQPLTRDCTIITNGNNYLRVYVDGDMVYSSGALSLGMTKPYDYYLQTMNADSGIFRFGTFQNYYVTSGENLKIIDSPPNASTASLVDQGGNVLASAPVVNGTAIMHIGKYQFPLNATMNVYDSSNTTLASETASIFGGDVYSMSSLP